jgi:acetoin utilization deacetylase AcuC-like enzyme
MNREEMLSFMLMGKRGLSRVVIRCGLLLIVPQEGLKGEFELIEPEPASDSDLERVHGRNHIQSIKRDPLVYEIGLLSAGGAILAAELAFNGQPAFGLIRPQDTMPVPILAGVFVIFNNVAIAIKKN